MEVVSDMRRGAGACMEHLYERSIDEGRLAVKLQGTRVPR